jgi:hypothetical protein
MNNNQRKKILTDHKKVGAKLVPPLLSVMGESDYSYVEKGIPQIIWIALLNKKFGLKTGTSISWEFVEIIDSLKLKKDVPYNISWFSDLKKEDISKIKDDLKLSKVFDKIRDGLSPLLNVYPKCPLNKIFGFQNHSDDDILIIKETLIELYDKYSRESTFALANTVYYMGMCKKLHIVKNSHLENLENLIHYPKTEESKIIASMIRATTNILLSDITIENSKEWVHYFWNRGLELEPCAI